ncbi:hypothetical protein BD626DRAFT_578842 [Schizophyllum amplum]|uniref:Uncharacterized protein n=1 Tax=Schizophyllum amplum TaxID=97359 RepID=A0A550BRR9_9AGAR|nr:hypothetical protein BD626DRAFT_578842 [Auriculariopsis ampla]
MTSPTARAGIVIVNTSMLGRTSARPWPPISRFAAAAVGAIVTASGRRHALGAHRISRTQDALETYPSMAARTSCKETPRQIHLPLACDTTRGSLR